MHHLPEYDFHRRPNQFVAGPYAGMRVVEDAMALEDTAERLFPVSRHRSARVRKKLIQRHGGEFRRVPCAFLVGGSRLVVHPVLAAQIRAQISAQIDGAVSSAIMKGLPS